MPVTIRDVLALLPELFPGVQKIPMANIRPNPENPGPRPTEEAIANMAANIELVGLKNAIKVMPDPAGPLSPGATLHPDNPRLRGDGTPWAMSDFRHLNLSGHLRQLAHERLKRTEINGNLLNPPPEEVAEIIGTDNKILDKGWWANCQLIELHIKANPNQTQKTVSARLGLTPESVNWAMRLLPLLNSKVREGLFGNTEKQNKGKWGISEIAASHLIDLGPGSTFKRGGNPNDPPQALYPYPPVPPETQDLVYRAFKVAIDHQMTKQQVIKLVEWVKAGNAPG